MKMMIAAAGLLVAALAMPAAAYACAGPNVLFEDDFASVDASWGNYTNVSADHGKLTIQADANSGNPLPSQGNLYGDMDYCVDIQQPTDDAEHTWGGALFWEVDSQNYYGFFISPIGSAELFRMQNGKSLFPINWTTAKAVKTGKGDFNTLRVVTKGPQVTLFINGTQFASLRGFPPQGGGLIGLYGAAGSKSMNFNYANLKVTDVAADFSPAAASASSQPSAPSNAPPSSDQGQSSDKGTPAQDNSSNDNSSNDNAADSDNSASSDNAPSSNNASNDNAGAPPSGHSSSKSLSK